MYKIKYFLKVGVKSLLVGGLLILNSFCTNNADKEKTIYGYNLNDFIFNQFLKVDSSGSTVIFYSHKLEWKRCSQGQTYRAILNDCKGSDLLDLNDYGGVVLSYCPTADNNCNSTTLPMVLNSYISLVFTSCENDLFDGKSDWRVPTVMELDTILQSNRTTFLELFPDTPYSYFWSSNADLTSENLGYTRSLAVSFQTIDFGEWFSYDKSRTFYVRCVRDFP